MLRTVKSSGSLRELVTLAQQVSDLRLRRVGRVLRNRRDVSDLHARVAQNLLLHRRVRRKRNVVLIAALRILSLARHHADDAKRQIHHANVWPIGSCPEKIVGEVWPITITRAAVRTSASVKNAAARNRPLADLRILFADALNRSVPVHVAGDELRARVDDGVTIETLGTSRLIASRSSTVSVLVPVSPVPLRTPPTFCAPALTKSRLVPMLSICACTEADAPWPMLTIAITAETPMMMPSMVSAARILLRTKRAKGDANDH
jgi:hypothetical protein